MGSSSSFIHISALPCTSSPGKSSRKSSSSPLPGWCRLGSRFPSPICKPAFFNSGRIFSCLLNHKGSTVPGSLASQCSLLKQPSNLPWNPKASFPMTRDSKEYHPFPILIMAERVSFWVSNSPKYVQVFLLELANFQAELPVKISLHFNTFSLALGLWKQLHAAGFPGSPSQQGCKFVFPGTTIPRRQFIFPQPGTKACWVCCIFQKASSSLSEEGMSLPAANRRRMYRGQSILLLTAPTLPQLCAVRGEHLRSMPEGTASTFIEPQHPKQKWRLKGWLVLV